MHRLTVALPLVALLAACSSSQNALEDRVINVETDAILTSAPPPEDLAGVLKQSGTVSYNKFLLKFNLVENGDPYEFTVFPDGRAIIKGTSDTDRARTLYAKYIGH